MAKEDKFETEDLPKILAALKAAKDAGAASSVIVNFSDQGGVLSVVQESKRRFK